MSERAAVAIVGAGFCGTLVAVHLARAGARVVLIEQRGRFGPGLAYGAAGAGHVLLLNTPAGRMSAFAEDAEHFVRWAAGRGIEAGGGSFLRRSDYGEYLAELLIGSPVTCLSDQVMDVVPAGDRFEVVTARGTLVAERVVMAVGNLPPADPPGLAGVAREARYHRDPWRFDPRSVAVDRGVLLVGSGLTALDVAQSLASAGHRGALHMVSRRGLLPQPHRATAAAPHHVVTGWEDWPATARGLVRAVRAEIRRSGVDWRDTIAALRPHTAALWQRLPRGERDRFLRHVRPYWDAHRHRSPPATDAAIAALRAEGRLVLHAGSLVAADAGEDGLRVWLRPRGAGAREVALEVSAVINCTGPATDITLDPLLARLHARGLVARDPLGLGVVADADGEASPGLFFVGPLRRADTWESTAVLELSEQARVLAARVLAGLRAGA